MVKIWYQKSSNKIIIILLCYKIIYNKIILKKISKLNYLKNNKIINKSIK